MSKPISRPHAGELTACTQDASGTSAQRTAARKGSRLVKNRQQCFGDAVIGNAVICATASSQSAAGVDEVGRFSVAGPTTSLLLACARDAKLWSLGRLLLRPFT